MAVLKKVVLGTEGCVNCPTCAYEISVVKTTTLPREFSALCPNCGKRNTYLSAEVHDPKQIEEIIQHSARIEFGKRNAIDCDQMVAGPEQPKSRLGEIASWLLE
jgi:uncharacterized Zn finger protein (UPF0148 family)